MSDQQHSHSKTYAFIFGLLCFFTALSWIADKMKEHGTWIFEHKLVVIVVVLAIAAAKAGCVMLYFMHLKFERNWKYVLLAPTIILAIGVPLALMPDIGVHYYLVDTPQSRVTRHQTMEEEGLAEPAGAEGH